MKKLIMISLILLHSISIAAQEKKENEKKEDKVEKKDKSKSIADLTKSSKKIDGLFAIFRLTQFFGTYWEERRRAQTVKV